ncbi:MAG: hypothetical protein ACTHKG_10275 [Nocardioides sp.]
MLSNTAVVYTPDSAIKVTLAVEVDDVVTAHDIRDAIDCAATRTLAALTACDAEHEHEVEAPANAAEPEEGKKRESAALTHIGNAANYWEGGDRFRFGAYGGDLDVCRDVVVDVPEGAVAVFLHVGHTYRNAGADLAIYVDGQFRRQCTAVEGDTLVVHVTGAREVRLTPLGDTRESYGYVGPAKVMLRPVEGVEFYTATAGTREAHACPQIQADAALRRHHFADGGLIAPYDAGGVVPEGAGVGRGSDLRARIQDIASAHL